MKNRRNPPHLSHLAALPVLEELSFALTQLGRLAETVAARLSRGDSAADWLPQLTEQAARVRAMFAAADDDTRDAVRDCLAETAEVVRLAASCGDEWLDAHRQTVDADTFAARLRRAYGLDAESAPLTLDWPEPTWPSTQSTS